MVFANWKTGSNGNDNPTPERYKSGVIQQKESQKDGTSIRNTRSSPTVSGYGTKLDDKNQEDSVSSQKYRHYQEQNRRQRAGQLECERLSGSTYYELLGVDRNATDKKIKKAWRKKDSGQYLPIELRTAYHSAYMTLSVPKERRKYDAKPWKWIYEKKPYQRREQKVLSSSFANSKRGLQAAVSSNDKALTSQRISGTTSERGIRKQSERLSGYNYFPRRAYRGRSSYTLCQACRWRQRTIGSGRARSIGGVSRWASANCTCRG